MDKTGKRRTSRVPAATKRLRRAWENDLKRISGAFRSDASFMCLFAGACGTDKSMAAEVLAEELDLDLHRVDLSAVVSKYIAETEKNLGRIFDAAGEDGWILFFDEADALFGKRSEVKDSHDRYANMVISYLLQRLENHRGLIILATDTNANVDPAFLRRFRYIIDFHPIPVK